MSASDLEDLITEEIIRAITSITLFNRNGRVEIHNAKNRKAIQTIKNERESSVEII